MGILDIFKSNNKLAKFLNNIPLIKIDNDAPDLEYIKRKSYQMHRKCMKLPNPVIHESIGAIRDAVWGYGDKEISSAATWMLKNIPTENPAYALMDSWWSDPLEKKLAGNTEYLTNVLHTMQFKQGFYNVATQISESVNPVLTTGMMLQWARVVYILHYR